MLTVENLGPLKTFAMARRRRRCLLLRACVAAAVCDIALAAALCPPYPPPANGTVSSAASTPVGVSIVITCDNGFKAVGRATPACAQYPPSGDSGGYDAARGNRTAAERGGYQNGATCEPLSCGRFPAPQNARVEPEGPVGFGSRASIICAPGFRAVGLPGSSQTPMCQSDGSFEMGKRCQRIQLDCLRYASISVGLFCACNRSLLPYDRPLLTLTHTSAPSLPPRTRSQTGKPRTRTRRATRTLSFA